jgi:hypothetical protein
MPYGSDIFGATVDLSAEQQNAFSAVGLWRLMPLACPGIGKETTRAPQFTRVD